MRPDQIARLEQLSEQLADVFIVEADPENWTAGGVLPKDMSQQQRGDRHWDRKGAIGTGAVLSHVLNVLKSHGPERDTEGNEKAEDDLDEMIKAAESKARKAVNRVIDRAKGKEEFDRRVGNGA